MTVSDTLLAAVRNYLDITYVDTASDNKLRGIIGNGIRYLDDVAGTTQNYDISGMAQSMLYEYARYVRSGALDDFTKNYNAELSMLRLKNEVDLYAQEHYTNIQ